MTIQDIKQRLESKSIFLAEDDIDQKPAVIGYEKKFKWSWFATQLNTFVIAADFGDEAITEQMIESFLAASFDYSEKHYRGWPRGFQSSVGVIGILISKNVDDNSARYCTELRSGKKWAGFSVPIAINSRTNETFRFERNPVWGRIYYPYFKKIIDELTI